MQRLMLCRQPLVWGLNRWSCYHEYWDIGDGPRKSLDNWFGEGYPGVGRLRMLRGCTLGLGMERMKLAGI